MFKFSVPVCLGADPTTNRARFGFSINDMFIFDPTVSECGRFEVRPDDAYGLSETDVSQLAELNRLLDVATHAAVEAGHEAVRKALGLPPGHPLCDADTLAERLVDTSMQIARCIEAELVKNNSGGN